MAPINVTTSKQQIQAAVSEDKVTATVSAGIGPTGPQGPQGPAGPSYTLPVASAGTLGGVQAGGTGITIDGSGVISVTSGAYATLVNGTVPSNQLPSFVDDVVEVATFGALPSPGETGKIYVVLQTNKVYRWTGHVYIEIVASPGSTDSLAEGSVNLYHTNARASAAAPVQSVAGRTGTIVLGAGDIVSGTLSASRLPIASAGSLGGVRIGSGISIDGSGVISASSGYTLPTASANTLGGVKIGSGITITDGVISVSSASVAWDDITSKPSTFAPSAHAASHAAGGADQLFDQSLNKASTAQFESVKFGENRWEIGWLFSGTALQVGHETSSTYFRFKNDGTLQWPDNTFQATAYTGKIGTVAGLVLQTGTDGVIEALAMGTAGQVLKVNSGATGVEWGSAAADVSIDTTAADILSASSGSITADDAGSDKLVFWDDSAGKLTYLSAGTNITITDTTISAAGSTSASDLTSGTLAYARMADPTVTSPSQITASQNDYSGFARGINRFTTNAARDLTGMVAGSDGEVRVLTNVGTTAANTLVIKDESASSTAANRFSVPWNGDCVIPAEGSVVVFYDGTSQRWRVIA